MNFHGRLLRACVLVAVACPVLVSGQKVTVDHDRSVDFAKFRTYSWGQLVPAGLTLLRLHIMGAIDEQLAAKGLVKAENDADLMVTYAGDVVGESNQAVSAPAYPGYAGPAPAIGSTMWTGSTGAGGTGMALTYSKRTLVVELMDARAGRVAWRGVGNVKLDIETKSDSLARINDLIAKMFVRYPPQKTVRQ